MTDMQTSLPLLIVRPSILNPIINFSTHLWPVKWKCPRLYLCLVHSHSISFDVDATHAPTNHQMIWSTSYHHMTVLVHRSWPHLLFTVASVHRRQVLDLPFTLATGPSSQASSWSSPPWSYDLMSCLMCNKIIHHHMCKLFNISKPLPPPWHMLLTYMYLWTNHLCISHKHN
jgi:hypothetical protein